MRISDWSSDVCSSDLKPLDPLRPDQVGPSGYSGTIGVMPTLQAKPMTSRDIDDVIDAFAKGAKTAYDLGFDGVAVHGGHGYLLVQFFWAETNRQLGSASCRESVCHYG